MLKRFYQRSLIEAGCDEAGRGCLAGPVYAAAVILPINISIKGLNDSKKLSEKKRLELRDTIIAKALSWGVASVSPEEIDEINILNASFLAMHRAIEKLKTTPQHLLIDGNRFNEYEGIPHSCIIKGDSKYASIAAASILAKTFRDEFMEEKHLKYPHYDWDNNKGYPTIKHRQAIQKHGLTKLHRKTFRVKVSAE